MTNRSRQWMWADAVELLGRIERLRSQGHSPALAHGGVPGWEPPVDLIETDHEVIVLVALPGVDPQAAEAFIEEGVLVVRGRRELPEVFRAARIHRLELPQGRFERRLRLPAGRYHDVRRSAGEGCLVVTLRKNTGAGGHR